MKKYKKIYIEITNNCNLSCSFCSKDKREKRSLSIEEFENILSKIKDYTDYIYLHVKGEPLLHKNIIEFLHLAEKYNLKVNLTTNGILIKDKLNELIKCDALKKINFSLHSENNKDNYLDDIFESVEVLSTKIVVIYRLWTLSNNKLDKKSTETVEKIKSYYNLSTEIVDKLYTEDNVLIKNNIYVDKDNEFKWPTLNNNHNSCGYCYALKTHIAILSNGVVVPCCLDSEGIINLGNIFEQELEEIINSKRYQQLKKSFQDRKPSETLCCKCTFKDRLNN